MHVYYSLMICVVPLHAEGHTSATITLRYICCCFMMDELQLIRRIPLALGKYFFRVSFSKSCELVLSHGTAGHQVAGWGMTTRCTW